VLDEEMLAEIRAEAAETQAIMGGPLLV